MTAYFNILTWLYLLGLVIGMLTAIILWFFPTREHKSRKILGIIFLVLGVNMFIGFIVESKLIYNIPDIYHLADPLCFIFLPLAYLYVRSMVERQYPDGNDLIHFIPLALLIVNYVPFLNLPTLEKVALITQETGGKTAEATIQNGSLFSADISIVVYHILFCSYWFLQIWLILKLFRYSNETLKRKNGQAVTWLIFFIGIQFFFYYPYFILSNSPVDLLYKSIGRPSGIAALLLSAAYLFIRPQLLYGSGRLIVPVADNSRNAPKIEILNSTDQVKSTHQVKFFTESRLIEIEEKLVRHIEQHTPYLNHGYNLKDMAQEMDLPLYILSYYINKEKGIHFNDFLNKYRVEYCKQKIEQGDWKNTTLEGLAYDSGFNNRNSFTTAFKKYCGKTPSAYLKELK